MVRKKSIGKNFLFLVEERFWSTFFIVGNGFCSEFFWVRNYFGWTIFLVGKIVRNCRKYFLVNIYFLVGKVIWLEKYFGWKFFWKKFFCWQFFFFQKNYFSRKNCLVRNFFDQEIFLLKKKFGLGGQIYLGKILICFVNLNLIQNFKSVQF